MLKITIIKNDASLVKNAQFLPMGGKGKTKQNKTTLDFGNCFIFY